MAFNINTFFKKLLELTKYLETDLLTNIAN